MCSVLLTVNRCPVLTTGMNDRVNLLYFQRVVLTCYCNMSDSASAVSKPPSEFARDDGQYNAWANNVSLAAEITPPQHIETECSHLMELVIPSELYDVLKNVSDPEYQPFARELLRELPPPQLAPSQSVPADHNRIVAKWWSIADAYNQIKKIDVYSNEATLRKGIDLLLVASTSHTNAEIELVIPDNTVSANHLHRNEQSVRLIKSELETPTIPSPVAQADAVIVHPFPPWFAGVLEKGLADKEFSARGFQEMSWRGGPATASRFLSSILMSAIEYKVDDEVVAFRQLMYDLGTAQIVRQTLKQADKALFGFTATRAGDNSAYVSIYACWQVRTFFLRLVLPLNLCSKQVLSALRSRLGGVTVFQKLLNVSSSLISFATSTNETANC